MFEEGTIADGPNGPIVFRGGRWQPLNQQGGVFTLPQTPAQIAAEQRQAAADARAAEADARASEKAAREAAEWNAKFNPDGTPKAPPAQRAQITAKEQADAIQAYRDSFALDKLVADLRKQFKEGPGATKGPLGLLDYLPTEKNKTFDDTGQQARAYVKRALGFTGGEGNTATEASSLYDPYLPNTNTSDGRTIKRIDTLEQLAKDSREKAIAMLGGIPDANGNITPVKPGAPLTPMDQASAEAVQAATGPTKRVTDPKAAAAMNALFRSGASFEQLNAAAMALGAPPINPMEYAKSSEYAKRNPNYEPFTVTREVPTTARERISASDGAAFFGSLGNMAGAGIPEAISPEQFAMARENSPTASLLGGVAGSLVGTGAIGAVGRNTIGRGATNLAANMGDNAVSRALNRLTAQTTGGRFGRNLATDMAYGGIYGTATEGDPLMGALTSGVASVGGQTAGSLLGRTIGGVTSSPTVTRLRARGVTPTIGQIFRGRAADNAGRSFIAGVEDTIANTGAIGSIVNTARTRALEDANNAAYRVAADGAPITGFGQQALDQLDQVKTGAYSQALDGVSLPVNDPRFISQIDAADQLGRTVDQSRGRGDFGYVMDQELAPIVYGGQQISGRQLQDALRLLQGQQQAYRKAATGPVPDPSAIAVTNAFGKVEDAFTGLTARNAPDAIPGLKKANRINRNLSILDDAAGRAMNDEGLFTAAQLSQAIKANSARFGGNRGLRSQTKSPLYQLQQDMQAVLPNQVPPTGVNVAPMLALGGAAVTGAGSATDNEWLKTAGLLGLLATPYTKAGQKAVAKAMLDRPQSLALAGSLVRKHKGLFGSAAVPLLLEAQK